MVLTVCLLTLSLWAVTAPVTTESPNTNSSPQTSQSSDGICGSGIFVMLKSTNKYFNDGKQIYNDREEVNKEESLMRAISHFENAYKCYRKALALDGDLSLESLNEIKTYLDSSKRYLKVLQGDPEALVSNALFWYPKCRSDVNPDKNCKAMAQFEQAAEQNDTLGMYLTSMVYFNGDGGIEKDRKVAFDWMKKTADSGDAQSIFYLGLMYRFGEGTARDTQKAKTLILEAADKGCIRAAFYVQALKFDTEEKNPRWLKNGLKRIPLHSDGTETFQNTVDLLADITKDAFDADEALIAVMESDTGKMVALTSSNRAKDGVSSAAERTFEPGANIMAPVYSLLLEHEYSKPVDVVRTYNGRYELGRKVITDDFNASWLSAANVLARHSNIGMAQLAQKLDAEEYHNGLKRLGFGQPTGIDLPNEQNGTIPSKRQMYTEIYKASVSYGYALNTTFIQMLGVYNIINNDGFRVKPTLAVERRCEERTLSKATAETLKTILDTNATFLKNGTEFGGSYASAYIAENGRYLNRYNVSFFGYMNDDAHKYTIGVTVLDTDEKDGNHERIGMMVKKIVKLLGSDFAGKMNRL